GDDVGVGEAVERLADAAGEAEPGQPHLFGRGQHEGALPGDGNVVGCYYPRNQSPRQPNGAEARAAALYNRRGVDPNDPKGRNDAPGGGLRGVDWSRA